MSRIQMGSSGASGGENSRTSASQFNSVNPVGLAQTDSIAVTGQTSYLKTLGELQVKICENCENEGMITNK
jgi:hypothetical protein